MRAVDLGLEAADLFVALESVGQVVLVEDGVGTELDALQRKDAVDVGEAVDALGAFCHVRQVDAQLIADALGTLELFARRHLNRRLARHIGYLQENIFKLLSQARVQRKTS